MSLYHAVGSQEAVFVCVTYCINKAPLASGKGCV
jgi:hypothetical protein